MTYCKLPYIKL